MEKSQRKPVYSFAHAIICFVSIVVGATLYDLIFEGQVWVVEFFIKIVLMTICYIVLFIIYKALSNVKLLK